MLIAVYLRRKEAIFYCRICLSVCLFVSNFTQKLLIENSAELLVYTKHIL